MQKLDTLTIDKRFCGPPDSGNGGYVAGMLAQYCGPCARVRLSYPPPLGKPLNVFRDGEQVHLVDGDQPVATAQIASLEMPLPEPVTLTEATEAARHYTGFDYHPFPRCFVCGPERKEHDGLRIFPGHEARPGMVAAPWVPDETLDDGSGFVRPEFIWAALDCTGAFALEFGPGKVLVLGQFTVDVRHRPRVGENCVVTGWNLGSEGRKNFAGTAVYDEQGRLCGLGQAVWIELKQAP